MARSKSRRRETDVFSNGTLPVYTTPQFRPTPVHPIRSSALREFEDRRTFYPTVIRPAATFSSPNHRLVAVDRSYFKRPRVQTTPRWNFQTQMSGTKASIAFAEPTRTLICVRRQQRREVLHALNKTGHGTGATRYSRWNEYSNVRCK